MLGVFRLEGAAMFGEADYEVKFLVIPKKTVDGEGQPKEKFHQKFKIKKSTRAVMAFLDSGDQTLYEAGWIVRVRAFDEDDEPNIELTYKKRQDLENDSDPAIDGMWEQVAREGFRDAQAEKYDAQVEWGRDESKLTASGKADDRPRDPSLADFPEVDEARRMVVSKLPSVLAQQVPEASSILENAHLYGPVFGVRYTGEWKDDKVTIEVWTVRTEDGQDEEQIVEVSFKKKPERRVQARERRGELHDLLDRKRWMALVQLSKTKIILDRYGPPPPAEADEPVSPVATDEPVPPAAPEE
jgi:hypothetical protein